MEAFLASFIFPYLLVFARLGAALSLIPPLGEEFVSMRVRLLLALALTVVVKPVVSAGIPGMPAGAVELFLLLGGEIFVGAYIGLVGRILLMALVTAGTIAAFMSSLANAMVSDPVTGTQSAAMATFLMLTGLTLLFVTELHHLVIRALVDSYVLFVPGELPPIGDFSEVITRVVAQSFLIGFQLSAPFVVVSIVMFISMGFLARLIPTIQVFFIVLPLQILTALAILGVTLSGLMLFFIGRFEGEMVRYLRPY
ncbi:MAG: flagellar biosynthetic protein FliR [Acetobacterales bacterium]